MLAGGEGLRAAAALALAAIPGVIGWLGVRRVSGRPVLLLTLWTVFTGLSAVLSGGAAAPLGVYALAPALAATALGAPWTWAVGWSTSAAAFAAVAQFGGAPGWGDPLLAALLAWAALAAAALFGAGALNLRLARRTADPAAPAPVAPIAAPSPAEAAPVEPEPEPGRAELLAQVAAAEAGRVAAVAEAASRSRFLANMSHELRTPLNAIQGFSDIMRTRLFGPLPDRYAEYAELIHESGRHLTDLINDVLDLSKIDAERYELRREVFDLREPVNAALRLLRVQADEAGLRLRGVLPPEPLTVDADHRAIKQMVLNLVGNALKFTPKGGEITVSLVSVEGAAELVVADSGVGIAPEDLSRLGRPFEQADAGRAQQGAGLGLSLVRGFARLHGGELKLESVVGEGTVATVILPVLAPAAPSSPISAAHDAI